MMLLEIVEFGKLKAFLGVLKISMSK